MNYDARWPLLINTFVSLDKSDKGEAYLAKIKKVKE